MIDSMAGRRRRFTAFDGVALRHPARESFLEHALIPPAELIEDVAGPPGQRVRARSVEDDQAGLGDFRRPLVDHPERHGAGALDVALGVLLPVAHVDDVGLGAAVEYLL